MEHGAVEAWKVFAVLAGLGAAYWGMHLALLKGLRAPREPHTASPSAWGMHAESVTVQGVENQSLFAWYLRPQGPGPHPGVVLMHGWGANASLMLPVAASLVTAGYAVLVPDARCHGRSSDAPHTSLPRFAQDMAAALGWLRQQPDVDGGRLALVGHSVGGAAAILCATQVAGVGAVVSASAFQHPRLMMRRYLKGMRIPYWPLGWFIIAHVQRVIGARFADIAPVVRAPTLRCPLLLVHGREDTLVPFADAQAIVAACGDRQDVTLLPVSGDHDLTHALNDHGPEILQFLSRALGGGQRVSP